MIIVLNNQVIGLYQNINMKIKQDRRAKRKLTKELAIHIAKKYKTKNEFRKDDSSAYRTMKRKGWDKEACKHMPERVVHIEGRCLSKEFVIKEAQRYYTKKEFQFNDPSCYATANRNRWYEAFAHMSKQQFSVPQLICKQIFDKLFNTTCRYNTRSIIHPYELDLYYEEFNFAVEYNGEHWHDRDAVKRRDKAKKKLCKNRNISLLHIKQKNRKYEIDIKEQIIASLPLINSKTGLSITENIVHGVIVDYQSIFDYVKPELLNLEEKINSSKNIKDFRYKYGREFRILYAYKLQHLLLPIKRKHINVRKGCINRQLISDKELIDNCKKYTTYKEFRKKGRKLYDLCYRRGLLDIVSVHMDKTRNWRKSKFTESRIRADAARCNTRTDFHKKCPQAYELARKSGLLVELFPTPATILIYAREKILNIAKTCKTRKEFYKNHQQAYARALKTNLIDEIYSFLPQEPKNGTK